MRKTLFLLLFLFLLPSFAGAATKQSVIGWIAYWKKDAGTASALKHLDHFTELSPFAYSVRDDGTLADTMKIKEKPWPELLAAARAKKIVLTPTIMWSSKKGMQGVLADRQKRAKHVAAIVSLVKTNNYDGIDIDYEGKAPETRTPYSLFTAELGKALHREGKILSCTIEARTGDRPQITRPGPYGGAWADDYAVLNKYCDEVRIMAYDQPFIYELPELAKYHTIRDKPYAPVADRRWVEEVIKYTSRTIKPQKIVIGIPTYGREVWVTGKAGKWKYLRKGSLNFTSAVALASSISQSSYRSFWGEPVYDYVDGPNRRLVIYQDRQSIAEKVALAKKYKIKGVAFFKIDGTEEDLIY